MTTLQTALRAPSRPVSTARARRTRRTVSSKPGLP